MKSVGTVDVLHLASYINDIVAKRKKTGNGSVVMKMDIEGAEIEVLADMILRGSFKHVDSIHIEYHPLSTDDKDRRKASNEIKAALATLSKVSKKFAIDNVNNENYGFTDFDLPFC